MVPARTMALGPTMACPIAQRARHVTPLHPPRQPFPLPYHTFAFRLAQGAQVAASLGASDSAVFDYATLIFANQGDFFGAGLNTSWVDAHIVTLAAT